MQNVIVPNRNGIFFHYNFCWLNRNEMQRNQIERVWKLHLSNIQNVHWLKEIEEKFQGILIKI